jgi:ABC-2 type transport system permease protein
MTASNAGPESSVDAQGIAPAAISATRPLYWSIRRELWENRSIYLAPLAVAALILLASLINSIRLPGRLHASGLDPVAQHKVIEGPYTFAALLLMFSTMVVGVFYCLDAFQGERRDRSILFWKSLPVSDRTTVLAKASIPLLVLPLVTFAITVVTQAIMLLLGSLRLLASGQSPAALWSNLSFFEMWVLLLYHLIATHALWWAPFWGWLLLVSAWARRAALLWATLPLLAIGMVEGIAFNTSHFAHLLGQRFMGGPATAVPGGDPMAMTSMTPGTPWQHLASPAFWLGLAVCAAFLAAAVRLRRSREPI